MNKKQKLLDKRKKIEDQIKDHKLKSVEGFKISDAFMGAFMGLLLMGVFMWIPVIGWLAMPFCIPVGAAMGTKIKQDSSTKAAEQLQKEIEKIDSVLEILEGA